MPQSLYLISACLCVSSCRGEPILVRCGDGKERKLLFDLLYITADHQEAQTHFGIKGSARCNFPCVLCEMPRNDMGNADLGTHRLARERRTSDHRELQGSMVIEMNRLANRRERRGLEVNPAVVAISAERKLGAAKSRKMGFLAWEGLHGVEEDGDTALFSMCAVDQLHTVEEGIVKHLRTCMVEYLKTKFPSSWQNKAKELDRRLQHCADVLRWPGWNMKRNRWFFFNDEPFSATELLAIRMVSRHLVNSLPQLSLQHQPFS
jgi:hypothetical protein